MRILAANNGHLVASKTRDARPDTFTLAADSRFRRYGPIDKHEARQPDVTGQSFAERARKASQMLRSMDPEKVKQVIEFHRGLNFFEALALAKREGKLIVPNDIHDRILTETTDEQYLRANHSVWTGTLVIYEAPDKKFGKNVIFSWEHNKVKYSFSFNVPEQFRGKANCALVIEHPDFELMALGDNRYELRVDERSVHQVESFAKENSWHRYDAETGIPHGEAVKESSDARHLWRLKDSSYLGPVARDYYFDYRRVVGLGNWPSGGYGVALWPI